MKVPRFLLKVSESGSVKRSAWLCLAISALLSNLFLVSCTGLFGGSAEPTTKPTPSELALAKLPWCSKPSMIFRDEGAMTTPTTSVTATATVGATATATTGTATPGATITPTAGGTPTPTVGPGTPSTITDWSMVEANLGFTVYLPPELPRNSCLVNAQATIHDPIIGGSFTIGYLLPDHSALTLSEALLVTQNTALQCNSSNGIAPAAKATPKAGTPAPRSTQVATLLCSGAKDTTNIVLSAQGTTAYLEQIFNDLQPHIAWIPAT